jgi:hypothetical protein
MIDEEIEQAKEYAEKWQPADGQAQRYIIQGYLAGSKSKEERIEELEKGNEELKEKNKSYEEIIESGSITLVKERLKNYKQFIKAKEIIKKFLLWENDWHKKTESKYELLKQAEQFLKE